MATTNPTPPPSAGGVGAPSRQASISIADGRVLVPHSCWVNRSRSRNGSVRMSITNHLPQFPRCVAHTSPRRVPTPLEEPTRIYHERYRSSAPNHCVARVGATRGAAAVFHPGQGVGRMLYLAGSLAHRPRRVNHGPRDVRVPASGAVRRGCPASVGGPAGCLPGPAGHNRYSWAATVLPGRPPVIIGRHRDLPGLTAAACPGVGTNRAAAG